VIARARWALVVMGAWMMGSICMSVVATENFYTIDRLLATSTKAEFYAAVQTLGHMPARDLLRYLSSELNRLYFQMWNVTQLVLGALVLWLIGRGRARPTTQGVQSPQSRSAVAGSAAFASKGVIVMLAMVALMLVYLTPQIVSLGRSLDFVPRDPAPPGMQRFWILHAAYTSLEMLKLLVGLVVTWWIADWGRTS
jgi:hypothetical protein